MGFSSIAYSIKGDFTPAAWCIIIAIVMDILDGRVARWTKSTSSFGIEYDSLADMVSFGVAPPILMYQMVLNTMKRPGMAIALFFVMAGALRLARFNMRANEGQVTTHFVGLPIPAAAGILSSFALSYELFEGGHVMTFKTIPVLMQKMPFFFNSIPILMVIISFLMLSTVPYAAFKTMKLNRPKSFQLFSFILIAIILVMTYPQNIIFLLFLLYLLSGLTGYIWRYFRLRQSLGLSFAGKKRQDGDAGPKDNGND